MCPELSVVVVAHDMARELPRTLYSLSSHHQLGLDIADFEVIVVDNGSPTPIDIGGLGDLGGNFRFVRLDDPTPSPATAVNRGIALAEGSSIGLIVDGARMASPGLLSMAMHGLGLAEKPVVASLGWHLGEVRHIDAAGAGYDEATEDALLDEVRWREDGYRLFEISTFGESSSRGWFGPMGESSALFMPAALWSELGGLDPAFALPGGGLVNHDLYRRAIQAVGSQLVVLLGEGTFHQMHGGAATSGRFSWDEMQADYAKLRGCRYTPPEQTPLFIGTIPPQARRHLIASLVALADREAVRRPSATRPIWRRLWTRQKQG